jgi:two-component system chemotaxis sensor kinase CheA
MHRPSANNPQLVVHLDTQKSDSELRDVFSFHVAPEAIEIDEMATVEAYGFFDDVPTPAAETEEAGYGFFHQEPAAPAPAADPGYGFFDDVPAAAAPHPDNQTDAEGFGFFDSAPGAPTAPQASTAPAAVEGEGFGLFIGAPGNQPQAAPAPQPEPIPAAPVAAAPVPSKPAEKPTAKPAAATAGGEGSSIRVAVEKVDQLINLVGELVITQAMLAEAASHLDPVHAEKLLSGIDLLSRNTRDLQESVMSIRMLPMSMVFSRFPRVVRDLAGKLGKQVELKTVGEGTELDKGLIEKITDPLTHLVRNSLDHGIEMPDKRIAAGKNPKGTLTLKASHQGGNIVIEVMDDGGGLHRERILAKAREKGMSVSDSMTDNEVWQLIMAPGFSTAEQITDVSGRGVGMDVVKRNIEGLGGKVELESSPGFGTRIIIRLPLTLAILDGMSVGVGGETFIVPLTLITESLQPREDDIKTLAGDSRVVHIRGEYLPLISLADIFGLQGVTQITDGIIVVVEAENGKAALFVDALLGQHQVVIKSLEANYRKVPGVSGATIMGDGSVALILDIAAVCRLGLNGPARHLAA